MLPLIGAAAGAGMGYLKNQNDQENEAADRRMQSDIGKYSWVKGAMQANPAAIHRAGNMWADIGQGALGGASFGLQNEGMMGGGATPAEATTSADNSSSSPLGVNTDLGANKEMMAASAPKSSSMGMASGAASAPSASSQVGATTPKPNQNFMGDDSSVPPYLQSNEMYAQNQQPPSFWHTMSGSKVASR